MAIEDYFIERAENAFIVRQGVRDDERDYNNKSYVFDDFSQVLEFLSSEPIQ